MNFSKIRRNKAPINYPGLSSGNIGFPVYVNPDPKHNMIVFDEMGCKPDSSFLHPSYWELCKNDLDYFRDDYNNLVEDELCDIDHFITLEQLMYDQQELRRMSLTNQLKKELIAADHGTFVEQLMLKQQKLRQFLDEKEESRLNSKYMNHQYDTQNFLSGSEQSLSLQRRWMKSSSAVRCPQRRSIRNNYEALRV
jgi:hypothetical protein